MELWNQAIQEDPRAVESLKGGTKRAVHKVEIDEADLEDVEGAWRNGTISSVSYAHVWHDEQADYVDESC